MVKHIYGWCGCDDDVSRFAKKRIIWIKCNPSRKMPPGFFQPLPITVAPWDLIAVYFITGLPMVDGYDLVLQLYIGLLNILSSYLVMNYCLTRLISDTNGSCVYHFWTS